MPGHVAADSHTDAIYLISAALPITYDAAGYGATTITWTAVDRVSDFIEYGSSREINKFTPIRGPIEFSKGVPDYGSGQMIMADMPADPGQILLKAADASQSHYSMKITYPDGEIHYLDTLISGWRLSAAKSGQFKMRNATVNVCKAPVVVAAP